MILSKFLEQDKYCRENNTPEGKGCDDCPAQDKEHCADALRNLCGRLIATLHNDLPTFYHISKELGDNYELTQWNQLEIFKGGIEFSE